MTIPLSQGLEAIIDSEDFNRLSQYKWAVTRSRDQAPYAQSSVKCITTGKFISIRMHRLLLNCPKGMEVDHINGNTLDNRKSNLRVTTRGENAKNRKVQRNKTGYKGVFINNRGQGYSARIQVDGKRINIGTYKDPLDAAKAYDNAALLYHKQYAKTNF